MRKKWASVLLVLVLLLQVISWPAGVQASSDDIMSKCKVKETNAIGARQLLANPAVSPLVSFLTAKQYTLIPKQITAEWVECGNEKVIVTLFPYRQDESTFVKAHLVVWNITSGLERQHIGAVAAVYKNTKALYIIKRLGGHPEVSLISLEAAKKHLPLPFSDIQGIAPKWEQSAPQVNIKVVHTSCPMEQGTPWESSAPLSTTFWKSVDVPNNGYSVLGFLVWSFHQKKWWYYDGNSMWGVGVATYVSNMDPNFIDRGLVHQWDYDDGYPMTWHDSMRQERIENCVVHYGCIGNDYPAVDIIAHADGSFQYSTWK